MGNGVAFPQKDPYLLFLSSLCFYCGNGEGWERQQLQGCAGVLDATSVMAPQAGTWSFG